MVKFKEILRTFFSTNTANSEVNAKIDTRNDR